MELRDLGKNDIITVGKKVVLIKSVENVYDKDDAKKAPIAKIMGIEYGFSTNENKFFTVGESKEIKVTTLARATKLSIPMMKAKYGVITEVVEEVEEKPVDDGDKK